MVFQHEIQELKELIRQDSLNQALQLANKLEQAPEVVRNSDYHFQLFELKCQIYRVHKDYKQLISLAEEVENIGRRLATPFKTIELLIKIAHALRERGDSLAAAKITRRVETLVKSTSHSTRKFKRLKAAYLNLSGLLGQWLEEDLTQRLENFHQALKVYQELDFKEGEAFSLICLSWYYQWNKIPEKAIEYAKQCIPIAETLEHKEYLSYAFTILGTYYYYKRDTDQSLKYYQQSLALREELGDKILIEKALNNLSILFVFQVGQMDYVREISQRRLEISTQLGYIYGIGSSNLLIGHTYFFGGALDQALTYYQKVLAIAEEMDWNSGKALALANIADVYREMGELDQAFALTHQGIALLEEKDKKRNTTYPGLLDNMGHLYWQTNELKKAYDHFTQSLALYDELKDERMKINCFYYLVLLCIDLNLLEEAEVYLEALKPPPDQRSDIVRSQMSWIAEALLLKTNPRARNRVKAEELLQSVIDEEVVYFYFAVLAMLHLCDLLLFELRTSGDLEVLKEIRILVQKLFNIAESQPYYSLLVETYLLQSKLALLQLDLPHAEKLLHEAQMIAEEKNLGTLIQKTEQERNNFQTQLGQWHEFVERKASIREILEFTQLEGYLDQVAHDRLFKREIQIQSYSREAQQMFQQWEESS